MLINKRLLNLSQNPPVTTHKCDLLNLLKQALFSEMLPSVVESSIKHNC